MSKTHVHVNLAEGKSLNSSDLKQIEKVIEKNSQKIALALIEFNKTKTT